MIRAIRYRQTDQSLIKKSFTIKIKHQKKSCFFKIIIIDPQRPKSLTYVDYDHI